MEEIKKEMLSKRKVIKRCLFIFFGTIAFMFLVLIIITNGKLFATEGSWEFLKVLLMVLGGFFVMIALIGFASYKYHNKHPKMYKELNAPKGKKYTGIFIIFFGIFLIIQGGYSYFTGLNEVMQTKTILIRIGFGIVVIIWGIYNLRKNKLNNSSNQNIQQARRRQISK